MYINDASDRHGTEKFEIGRILHLKSEIGHFEIGQSNCEVRFAISDFGFEMQDSSDSKFLHRMRQVCCPSGRGRAAAAKREPDRANP
jgi:hypothetical protein